MKIVIHGQQPNPARTRHLRYILRAALGRFTDILDGATLFLLSEPIADQAVRFVCRVQLRFLDRQAAEATAWGEDLSEATRRSANLAAELAVRCRALPKGP